MNDLLVQAGGLTGSASKRVEVARMIMSEEMMPILKKPNCLILKSP
jgi:hypothetical protein